PSLGTSPSKEQSPPMASALMTPTTTCGTPSKSPSTPQTTPHHLEPAMTTLTQQTGEQPSSTPRASTRTPPATTTSTRPRAPRSTTASNSPSPKPRRATSPTSMNFRAAPSHLPGNSLPNPINDDAAAP